MIPEAFAELHSGLPREGPGSDASTREALRRLPPLPEGARVLDVGCGPGAQTLVLARELKTAILAVDIHQPYLDELEESAKERGLDTRIETHALSMDALDFPAESFDLIWSEGAAYIIGVPRALRLWRPLLSPGGFLAFTEATWLTGDPPAEVAEFWQQGYPDIGTVEANRGKAEAEGFEVLDTFVLPAEDWWTEYYTPLQRRMEALRKEQARRPDLAEAIRDTEQEIDMFVRFGDTYGYVFYLLQRPATPA